MKKKDNFVSNIPKKETGTEEYDYLFKSIVVGDEGVGKTTLISKCAKGFFTEDYKMTIGVDFHITSFSMDTEQEGPITVRFQIWDIGEQERFSFIRPMYYRGSLGALIIFDLTSHESFEHLTQWIEEVRANTRSDISLMIIGNKNDLIKQRTVEPWEICNFIRTLNLHYIEISAKTGENVEEAIIAFTKLVIYGDQEPLMIKSRKIKIREDSEAGSLILLKYLLENKYFELFFRFFPELPDAMKREFLTLNFPLYLEKLKELREETYNKMREIFKKSNEIYRELKLYYESKEIYGLFINTFKNYTSQK